MDLNSRKVKVLSKLDNYRYACPAVHLDDKIYVLGGKAYGTGSVIETCEMYDLSSYGWKQIAPMYQARYSGEAVVINGLIWYFNGSNCKGGTQSIQRYSPEQNQWEVLGLKTVEAVQRPLVYF